MPCDTITTAKIDLGKVNAAVLDAAVRGMGLTGSVLDTVGATGRVSVGASDVWATLRYAGGVLSVRSASSVEGIRAAVKQAYTRTLVTQQAARYGWRVKQGQNGKLLLQR